MQLWLRHLRGRCPPNPLGFVALRRSRRWPATAPKTVQAASIRVSGSTWIGLQQRLFPGRILRNPSEKRANCRAHVFAKNRRDDTHSGRRHEIRGVCLQHFITSFYLKPKNHPLVWEKRDKIEAFLECAFARTLPRYWT